jgi:3'-phosphoadenosine 5'-phosphosulfate (PAPS) 3'-phosphatase
MKVSDKKLELPKCVEFKQRYEVNDMCVWIDPLDCTQGFINERKHEVTILVGLSYKGRPICGIIGHPYKPSNKGSVYSPSVYYGSSELDIGYAFEYNLFECCWNTRPGVKGYENEDALHKMVTVGYRKMTPKQKGVINNLGLNVVPAGGAGYKCLKLINREVGSLIFLDAKTSKWDTCAGEAIIRAMGGYTISQNSSQISY